LALNRRNTPLPKFGDRFDPTVNGAIFGGSTLALALGLTPEEAAAAAQPKPEKMYPQKGDRILLIRGDHKNQLLRPEMLELGAKPAEGFPLDPKTEILRRKNPANRMLVMRRDEAEMDPSTRARSADGVLVYSALCPVCGCQKLAWTSATPSLGCMCSQPVAELADAQIDTPVVRRLPMTPLGLDDEGFIVAADNFISHQLANVAA
jgi:rieske iron-sulfur protein